MPMTTTSVSTVLWRILFTPCSAPSVACTDILVPASSGVQLISPARSQGADDNTSSPRVTITCPGNSSSTSRSLMRWKSSDLFSSIRRNSCQLLGPCLFPSTCLLIPLPLFERVAAFRQSFPYSSHTISTRCTSPRNCLRTYSMTFGTYQSNETCGTSSETHNTRSDFVPDLKAPC